MPRYVKPPIPHSAETIIEALGANQARLLVLHWLGQHPNSTATAVSKATEIRYETVRRHLQDLTDLGIVRVSEVHSGARGQLYAVDQPRLGAELLELQRLLLSPPTSATPPQP